MRTWLRFEFWGSDGGGRSEGLGWARLKRMWVWVGSGCNSIINGGSIPFLTLHALRFYFSVSDSCFVFAGFSASPGFPDCLLALCCAGR